MTSIPKFSHIAQTDPMAEKWKLKYETERSENDSLRQRMKMLETHSKGKKFTPPKISAIKLKGQRKRIIFPDVHGSHMHKPSVNAFLNDLSGLGLTSEDVIIGLGDLVDCGGFLALHHVLGSVPELNEHSYKEDIDAANWFLDEVQSRSGGAKIILLEGNHDVRPEKWIVQQSLMSEKDASWMRTLFAPEFLLHLKERNIQYVRRDEKYIDDSDYTGIIKIGRCHFTHGTIYTSNAAKKYAETFGANIVYGHTHRADMWMSRSLASETFGAWNVGCLCEKQPRYMHSHPTLWSHGYGLQIVDDNETFLHINVPLIAGKSMLRGLTGIGNKK